MQYMGSKNRIAKEIIPIITKDLLINQWYVEPFVGGANLIDKIQHSYKIGSDNNKYLIALLKAAQDNVNFPICISKEEYMNIKSNKDEYPDWLVGFVGCLCSFRGKFFGGFASNNVNTKEKTRNYQNELINNFKKQIPHLDGIKFKYSSYDELEIPPNSIIYCDPPYSGVTGYNKKFDSDLFFKWCRNKILEGHKVYISEYNAPDDFVCIWEKEISSNFGATAKKAIEKLFIHKSQIR